ncbi:MAG TPA: isopeptide-forming domain-containing fimbrial protein [Candidatus Gallacutalibacter pullistercoris]|nr:isopeptide-forming domain-containing fimbrial protein [Candidatus Gallacutalibacter pullistercoris]
MDSTSKVVVTRNSAGGDYAGLKLTSGVTDGKVEAGAVVTITDNYCSGLSNNGVCVFEKGAKLTIMNNNNNKGTYSHGGGIYNSGDKANLTLPSDAVIYNNHSKTDGDDIFNNTSATITFGTVGTDWVLDDCKHLIDGWYQDGENARWQVCNLEEGEKPHAEEYVLESETATVTSLTALKAAHGLEPKDKVSYPGLDKQVKDDDEDWNDDVDAAAGQEVKFQLTSNVPTDLLNYLNPEAVKPPAIDTVQTLAEGRGSYVLTFHDKLNAMLTNPENYVVKIGETALSAGQYTLTATGLEDGCSFEIALDLAALYEAGEITDADIENATPITVTYDATLSADAVAGEYQNEAWVTAPEWTTEKDIVYVNTYAIDIFKYDQAEPTKGLEGAEFELYQKDTGGNVIEDSKQTLTSDANGKILVDGLDAGTYYLKEIKAPEGYVCSSEELKIVIPDNADETFTVDVNFANSQIPHTGGTGTLMFTIGGAAIIATAGVLLLVSRKKKKA